MSTSSLAQPEAGDDRLGVGARRRRRRPVRHQHAQQPLGPDRLGDEVGDERRVDPARQPEDGPLEAGLAELAADELADDPPGDVGVDRELVGQLERGRSAVAGGRRRSDIGAASSAEPDRLADRLAGRHVEARLGAGVGGRVGAPGPARSATIRRQLADLELGPLVAQQRQGDPLAPDVGQVGMSTMNSPSS